MRGTSSVHTILDMPYFRAGVRMVRKLYNGWAVKYHSSHLDDGDWLAKTRDSLYPLGCLPNARDIPNMGAITAAQVKNALARLSAHSHEYRLAAGAAQAFPTTYEWRASDWPPVESWAVDEASAVFGLIDLHLSDISVWISAYVALSISTVWNQFSIRGDDLSRCGRVFAPVLCQVVNDLIPSLFTRDLGSIAPPIYVIAAQYLNENNVLALAGTRRVLYIIDHISLLWLINDYPDIWGLPRGPITFNISREYKYSAISEDTVFSPKHGDNIILEATRSEKVPRCACYVPLLLNTLAQSACEKFSKRRDFFLSGLAFQ
ncbi:hypothetical protein GJ496_005988 [Pomphorhynchus laevis]|nr:hypothetical protein GJ496_005988 [Pomphorhynchus laevis]